MKNEILLLNTYLVAMQRAENSASMTAGASIVSTFIGLPGACVATWLRVPSLLPWVFALGLAVICAMWASCWLLHRRAAHKFEYVKSIAGHLQNRGLLIFKRPSGLYDVLDAAKKVPADTPVLDFSNLNASRLNDYLQG